MRISGNFLDRLLLIDTPLSIVYYFLFSFTIRIGDNFSVLWYGLGMFFLWILIDLITIHWNQFKQLEIDNINVILDGKKISFSEVMSIKFIKAGRNGFDRLLFRIIEEGQVKDICIMDKPKFLQFWGSPNSTTLKRLYYYFPDWKENEI